MALAPEACVEGRVRPSDSFQSLQVLSSHLCRCHSRNLYLSQLSSPPCGTLGGVLEADDPSWKIMAVLTRLPCHP